MELGAKKQLLGKGYLSMCTKKPLVMGLFHLLVWLLVLYAFCRRARWKALVPPLVLLLFILLIGCGVI